MSIAADPLFSHYPALAVEIDRLCRVPSWAMTGASALVCTSEGLLLELAKPYLWRVDAGGVTHIGLGAIGGSLEKGESLLQCLQREGREELGTPLAVLSAPETGLCAHESVVRRLALPPVLDYPVPCLFTIGANRYRIDEIDASTLAIATFWAEPLSRPVRGDLYGLITLPWDTLDETLAALPLPLETLRSMSGVQVDTAEPAPPGALIDPVWTVDTLRCVLAAGPLARSARCGPGAESEGRP